MQPELNRKGSDSMNVRLDARRTVWPFMGGHFVRIVGCAVLALIVYVIQVFSIPYMREKQIARKVESLTDGVRAGSVHFENSRIVEVWIDGDTLKMCGQTLSTEMVSELESLTNLRVLALNDTQVTDVQLQRLNVLTNLKTLGLANTQITDAVLHHLKGMRKLEWLYLDRTQVTDAGLEQLEGLTKLGGLRLDNTRITDAVLKTLEKAPSLKDHFLMGTQTTPEGRAILRKALPNCRIGLNP
jgi:hypothetical protein